MVYGDDPVGSMTLTWVVLAQGRIMRKYLVVGTRGDACACLCQCSRAFIHICNVLVHENA